MKTNFTQALIVRIILFILLCLYSFLVFGQADYDSIRQASPLHKFSGVINKKDIKLQWTLTDGNDASSITLEKSDKGGVFMPRAEYWVNMEGNYKTEFKWSDAKTRKGSIYYRLKITEANGKIQYSNVLRFTSQKTGIVSVAVDSTPTHSSDIAKL